MAGFTSQEVRFSGTLDSKGRITIPARIRDKLNLGDEERVYLELVESNVIRREFTTEDKALEFLSGLEGVERFQWDGKILEVVFLER